MEANRWCRMYLLLPKVKHVLVAGVVMVAPVTTAETYFASPSNYLSLLRSLAPGDTLLLEPGTYDDPDDVPGLPIFDLHGIPDRPIVIMGPESGERSVFLGRATHNTVRFDNASYIEVRNIEIDGRDLGGDGIKAQGLAHHVVLENILIRGVGSDQQVVGISTKAPAWNWTVRRCVIVGAGTGMYFGNSDGSAPFVDSLIEYNLVMNTIGYNLQIKHQIGRPDLEGMPPEGTTVIRHNVFSKAENGSSGEQARPNVLVGHWPLAGKGANDLYQIYGNLFYQNPNEVLFQGEGNVALHHNLFLNDFGTAINIRPHNDVPKMIRVFLNTVVANGIGIAVTGGASEYSQEVMGNAVFAVTPISAPIEIENITDSYEAATSYLMNPTAALGELDMYPKPGRLTRERLDINSFLPFFDWDRDFNGDAYDHAFRGAYSGEGKNPGWRPTLEIKILRTRDITPPARVTDLRLIASSDTTVTLGWTAPGDDAQGGGPAASYDLRYSTQPVGDDPDTWFEAAARAPYAGRPRQPGSQETMTVGALATATTYTFVLRSIDDAGNKSNVSNTATVMTVPVTLLYFTATAEERGVRLNWAAALNDGHVGFRVHRRPENGEWVDLAFVRVSEAEATPRSYGFLDEKLLPGAYVYRLATVDRAGNALNTLETQVLFERPREFVLVQNFPNPFNPSTTICFRITGSGTNQSFHVRLIILNLEGRRVRTLLNRRMHSGGYQVNWDGLDDAGMRVAAGVYIYRLQVGSFTAHRRLMLLK